MVIRIALSALLALAPLAARADVYLLMCAQPGCTASDGTTQPAGTALNRILWDGKTPFAAPPGELVVPDDGRPIYTPVFVH